MPTWFCNLPDISSIYWKLHMSCLKMFSYILQVFVWNVWCCTVSNFYLARDISIFYCSGGGLLFVWVSEWQLMHIVELISTVDGQIMETLDNIGIKLFRLGCTKRILVVSFFILLFCLCYVVPLSMHYILCLVTVYVKKLQNGRLLRFSKRADRWCVLSWSISNQKRPLH